MSATILKMQAVPQETTVPVGPAQILDFPVKPAPGFVPGPMVAEALARMSPERRADVMTWLPRMAARMDQAFNTER